MQAVNVVAAHGEPDAEALGALGLGGLDKRLTALEEGNGQTHARAGFLQRYQAEQCR